MFITILLLLALLAFIWAALPVRQPAPALVPVGLALLVLAALLGHGLPPALFHPG